MLTKVFNLLGAHSTPTTNRFTELEDYVFTKVSFLEKTVKYLSDEVLILSGAIKEQSLTIKEQSRTIKEQRQRIMELEEYNLGLRNGKFAVVLSEAVPPADERSEYAYIYEQQDD